MQKILFSALAIFAVVAMAGVGSWATWSDTETSDNNTITAGSLDLLVDGVNWDGTAEIVVDNVKPGDIGWDGGGIKNDGSIDGTLTFKVNNIVDTENTLIEPEDSAGDVTPVVGELCAELDVQILYDGTVVYPWGPLNGVGTLNLGTLAAGATKGYGVAYTVKNSADNTSMTDSCSFTMEAVLNQ